MAGALPDCLLPVNIQWRDTVLAYAEARPDRLEMDYPTFRDGTKLNACTLRPETKRCSLSTARAIQGQRSFRSKLRGPRRTTGRTQHHNRWLTNIQRHRSAKADCSFYIESVPLKPPSLLTVGDCLRSSRGAATTRFPSGHSHRLLHLRCFLRSNPVSTPVWRGPCSHPYAMSCSYPPE